MPPGEPLIVAAWICPLPPLAAALLITLLGNGISRRGAGYLATLAVLVSFGAACVAFFALWGDAPHDRSHYSTVWTWLQSGSFSAGLRILVDPLSTMMMLIVSGVGALIVGYSVGYMDGDDEERRYFAYMSIFVFSMLLLVQSGNLLLLLAGWGLVGLSSSLLIGFWQERPSAIAAAKKAFVMNAFGDATMALAFFLLIQHTGSLNFDTVFARAQGLASNHWLVNLVALGLLGGAVAKSAQLPLQTWLPDAMEGPTPVSALIHAATLVTARVYLIVRTHVLFELAPKGDNLAAGPRRRGDQQDEGRAQQDHAALLPRVGGRGGRARRDPARRRLLHEGHDPRRHARRLVRLPALDGRPRRHVPDRPLHVPDALRRL